jgi:hypothetical protein
LAYKRVRIANSFESVGGWPSYLIVHNLGHILVAVTQPIHGNSGCKIQIPPPLGIPEITSLATLEKRCRPYIGGDHVFELVVDDATGR